MKLSIERGHGRAMALVFVAMSGHLALAADSTLPYEAPPMLSAATLLPKPVLSSPNYRIRDAVQSDGFMYLYTLESKWGNLQVTSTPTVIDYARETDVAARLEALKNSKEFSGAVKSAAGGVVEGATSLVMDPVGAVGGAVSGVGAMFGRAREAAASTGAAGAQEDSKLAGLSGYSKVKREYAKAFGVDVYSRNIALQQELEAVARAGFAGNITANVAMMAIPGGAAVAVSVAGTTNALNAAALDVPPTELRKQNREALLAMGTSPELTDLMIGHGLFTPREQTQIVQALQSMPKTANRAAFIKQAVLTSDSDTAVFRQRQADMYADYHRSNTPLAQFVTVGEIVVAQRQDGTVVFCAPLDALYWTPRMAEFMQVFDGALARVDGIRGKVLVLGGTASPMARRMLKTHGWSVQCVAC